jgi:HlyD family secretion protein
VKRQNSIWIALFFLAGALASCQKREGAPEPAGSAVAVVVERIEPAVVDAAYVASGTIRGRQTAEMSSKLPATIREMKVKAGDAVVKGQVLALLDSSELEGRLRQARAGREEAVAGREEAEKALESARAQAAVAAATYGRFQALAEKRAVTRQELDEAEARHRIASAQEQMARAGLRRAASRIEQAEAELQATEALLSYTRLTAPFNGKVIERRADPGTLGAPGVVLLVVEETGAFRIEASVEESYAGEIFVGAGAQVSVEGVREPLPGRVVEVVPAVDVASRGFPVKVELSSVPEGVALRTGMFARVSFTVGQTERLMIPQSAVVHRGQLDLVYTVEDDRARLRLVTLGARRGQRVEVLSGLSANETVVKEPPASLQDGAPVTLSQ